MQYTVYDGDILAGTFQTLAQAEACAETCDADRLALGGDPAATIEEEMTEEEIAARETALRPWRREKEAATDAADAAALAASRAEEAARRARAAARAAEEEATRLECAAIAAAKPVARLRRVAALAAADLTAAERLAMAAVTGAEGWRISTRGAIVLDADAATAALRDRGAATIRAAIERERRPFVEPPPAPLA